MEHNTYQTPYPTCPHCGHQLNDDEMYCSEVSDADLWALPSREERTTIVCPSCDTEYWVEGSYIPHYTSAFSEEEL